jgi:hypothetical protein
VVAPFPGLERGDGAGHPLLAHLHAAADAIVGFQQIDAAQQGGLAAARGADDADHLAAGDVEIDAAWHFVGAKAFVEITNPHQRAVAIPGQGRNGPPIVG